MKLYELNSDGRYSPAECIGIEKTRTPAMAAGVADHVWTRSEIAGLLD